MNIYVGNLSGDVSDDDLRQAFESFRGSQHLPLLLRTNSVANHEALDSWRCLLKMKQSRQSKV